MHAKSLTALLSSLVLSLVLVSCSDTCGENMNTIPLAGFYSAGDSQTLLRMDSLEVRGLNAPGDSVLSYPWESKSELMLPFKIDADTTTYIFSQHINGISRQSTVMFIYSRTPRFDSYECGVSYLFDIKDIMCTGSLVDSVVCPKGFIDNANIQNLRIYFANLPDKE